MADQPTQAFAATFADELSRCGVTAICVAPGSRSAPLAMAFARHPRLRVLVHLDERCASFFALGLARTEGRPVALLCTSGTASAEFHAAVIEAHHSRVPLIVLTADRPPELREVGANQVIDQARLYGSAVRWYFDPGPPEEPRDGGRFWRRLAARAVAEATGPAPGPVHLNLPFREPLTPPPGTVPEPLPALGPPLRVVASRPLPDEADVDRLALELAAARRPLVVAGGLEDGERCLSALERLQRVLGAPLLAEPTSQLRRRGLPGLIAAYDAMLRVAPWAQGHRPDLVLRLGGVPTSKAVGEFLGSAGTPMIEVDPGGGWRDPELLAEQILRCDPALLLDALASRLEGPGAGSWLADWELADRAAQAALAAALESASLHEGHVVRALADALPRDARLLVGSSMPIRDVDAFWPATSGDVHLSGNRGASGIDGVVSTAMGAAAGGSRLGAVLLGDLSLYHDMNGLWAIGRHRLAPLIVVLDNNGGGIFHGLPQARHGDVFEELFGTPLGLRLEDVARLYDLPFHLVESPADLAGTLARALAGTPAMVCARFTRQDSAEAHRAAWAAVAAALA
ncbi:MAG TPA: 2-succinyl-5-enolpyruvyl-6-hydroxy-3-cyclohexene-1-carboxylic-acid synthase [Candidatus Dormibacteraeota bacterium]|jgi:2-succinyl-5-enolpyruvyl-6-hydroxy-3-cyclohexene-1-carboxylate synthase|nr:2-succinyl-5-enolpyruvyl-6-hydroxy-3-cyclohexene-1-carboxylic-acid synthase [Candidatus Dormibacteraeota bacterium]